MICRHCSKPLTTYSSRRSYRHCSLRCAAFTRNQTNPPSPRLSVMLPTMLAILAANRYRHSIPGAVGHEACPRVSCCRASSILVNKVPQKDGLPLDPHGSTPLPVGRMPTDASVLRGSGSTRDILLVAPLRQSAEIRSAIVQANAVDMVSIHTVAGRQTQQQAVQVDLDSLPSSSCRAARVAVIEVPPPLIDERTISSINDRVVADRSVAVEERNQDRSISTDPGRRQCRTGPDRLRIAGSGTKVSMSILDDIRMDMETIPTCVTDTGDGRLSRHRLSPSGGVTPPAVCTGAGAFVCELYHPWLTTSDLALLIYGSDDVDDCHATQSLLARLRRAGHAIESRPATWAPQSTGHPKAYRLADAVAEVRQ